MILDLVKVFLPATVAFGLGIAITPALSHYFYTHKMWKKKAGKVAPDGSDTPIFNKLHGGRDFGVPCIGGVVIWVASIMTVVAFFALAKLHPTELTTKLDFLSRNQTWLPLFTLITASLVGLADDLFQIYGGGGYVAGGLPLRTRILLVLLIGALGGTWFYLKLGLTSLTVVTLGQIDFGVWIVPLFMLVMLALFSGGVIDGIDGLAGGIMATIFAAYSGIAFFQNQINIAAFSAVLTGAILAFLWFNIPPARFYMGESGMLGLTAALSVVAFLTNAVPELMIIALPLFIASGSDIIQLLSKRFRGKKVFLIAPIHHHFEAIGWPSYKVVMRFWVISVICAVVGMALALVSH